jgi:hypothetical protein
MTMLRICRADGCMTKTLGEFCINHEAARTGDRSLELDLRLAPPTRMTHSGGSSRLARAGGHGR